MYNVEWEPPIIIEHMSENNEKTLGELYAEKYGKESGQPQTGDAIPVDTTKKDILEALTANIRSDWVEIELPTRNQFYPEGTCVTIRPFAYAEEKMLMTSSKAKNFNIINNLMKRCVQGIELQELTLADKVYLLFKLREISYGNSYKIELTCDGCEHPNALDIEINKLHVNYAPEDATSLEEIYLPDSQRKVFINLPRVKDESYLENPALILDNCWKFIERVEDIDSKDIIRAFVTRLSARDVSLIKQAIIGKDWGLDTQIKYHCTECETLNELALPLGADFFSASLED